MNRISKVERVWQNFVFGSELTRFVTWASCSMVPSSNRRFVGRFLVKLRFSIIEFTAYSINKCSTEGGREQSLTEERWGVETNDDEWGGCDKRRQ